jgi:hypothetical protein
MPKDSRLASHRTTANSKCRLLVSDPVKIAIDEFAEQHGLSHDLAVRQLVDFYYMRHFDLLIRNIRRMQERGLSPMEINQLSVLYTLLQHIDERVGLT